MKTRVCVVIPAYNESAVISEVIWGVKNELGKSSFDFQIVVVDDGSSDDTAQAAKSAGAKVIRHVLNSGAGGATATGLRYAELKGYDVGVTMDADGQHAPGDVVKGLKVIMKSDVDLLIGSRLIDSRGMSRVKVLGNRGLTAVTYILFGIKTTDSQSGLRVFSNKALKKLKWKTSGYEFCSEMLWRANQLKLNVDEYSIKAIYTDYSKAKGQNNWNAVNIIKRLIKRRIAELLG